MASSLDLQGDYLSRFEAHLFTPLGPINVTPIALCIVVAVAFFFVSLKVLFGTFSVPKIMHEYKVKAEIRKKYQDLFKSRDGIRFHIAWAKSRGEEQDISAMIFQLKQIDQVNNTKTV